VPRGTPRSRAAEHRVDQGALACALRDSEAPIRPATAVEHAWVTDFQTQVLRGEVGLALVGVDAGGTVVITPWCEGLTAAGVTEDRVRAAVYQTIEDLVPPFAGPGGRHMVYVGGTNLDAWMDDLPRGTSAECEGVRIVGLTAGSPFLVGLEGILRSALSERLAPIGILVVIAAPRFFQIRLSDALLHRAAWLQFRRCESQFDGMYEHLAGVTSGLLLDGQRPISLVLTEPGGAIRFVADPHALRDCTLRRRTLTRLGPLLVALLTDTLLTPCAAQGRGH